VNDTVESQELYVRFFPQAFLASDFLTLYSSQSELNSITVASMLVQYFLVAFSAALVPVSAHFNLNYPAARGFNDDKLPDGPCGGFDTPASKRTPVSTSSMTVDLKMGHDQNAVQILLGLGDNPGNNFNFTLVRTFRQEGLGEFCLKDIPLPTDLGIKDGMNATLQVVTNGDPNGGLYNVRTMRPCTT
jgi:hypothetical protein